jgi:hypothetical protein
MYNLSTYLAPDIYPSHPPSQASNSLVTKVVVVKFPAYAAQVAYFAVFALAKSAVKLPWLPCFVNAVVLLAFVVGAAVLNAQPSVSVA